METTTQNKTKRKRPQDRKRDGRAGAKRKTVKLGPKGDVGQQPRDDPAFDPAAFDPATMTLRSVGEGLALVSYALDQLRSLKTLEAAILFCMAWRLLFEFIYTTATSSGRPSPDEVQRCDSMVNEGLNLYAGLDGLSKEIPVYRFSIQTRYLAFRALVTQGPEAASRVLKERKPSR